MPGILKLSPLVWKFLLDKLPGGVIHNGGRMRAVVSDKKGHLYVSTSNLDGRGNPKQGDDKILKLTPKKIE